MGFSDTLKEFFDQGLLASKELASKAGEKAQDWGARGLVASKDFASRAGAKLQELGEKGSLMLEIKHLESQTKKLIGLLGAEIFRLYEQGSFKTRERDVKKVLEQIVSVKEILEKKDIDLKNVGKKTENEETKGAKKAKSTGGTTKKNSNDTSNTKNPGRRRTPGAKPKRKGGMGNSALPST
jgi:hypothetical protein